MLTALLALLDRLLLISFWGSAFWGVKQVARGGEGREIRLSRGIKVANSERESDREANVTLLYEAGVRRKM